VGKSTLLHILGTLDRPTFGEVIIDGQRVTDLKESEIALFRNKNVGFVFQCSLSAAGIQCLENLLIPG